MRVPKFPVARLLDLLPLDSNPPVDGPCGAQYQNLRSVGLDGATQYLIDSSPVGVVNATGGHYLFGWAMFTGSVPAVGRPVIIANGDMQTFSTDTNICLYWNGPTSAWAVTRTSNTGAITTVTKAHSPVVDVWYFVEGWWDGSTNIKVTVDRAAASQNAVAGTNATFSKPLTVGANGLGGNRWTGRIDAAGYANINPEGVAGLQTAIYNGGDGVRFDELSGAQQAFITSWYELGELDGESTSCDFATVNHLTRVGSPTQEDGKT